MKVGIIGASGYIGSALATKLQSRGMSVVGISRAAREDKMFPWRVLNSECLRELDILINLAGEPIDQRWTSNNQKKFYQSRVELTQQLAFWMRDLPESERPSVWLNASAVGIYGDRGDDISSETSTLGEGYLAELCIAWENAAKSETLTNCRIVFPRIGVVLGKKSHAWSSVFKIFKIGIGGKLSSGHQWFPWIHEADVIDAIAFLVENENAQGAFNIVAPESVTNAVFTKALGKAINRPSICTIPAWLLRIVLGNFSEALLSSLRVKPSKLEELGYQWKFPRLCNAFANLIANTNKQKKS